MRRTARINDPINRRSRRSGFTLIQLLVVIGILVVLMGLLLPAVLKAYRTGVRTRMQADLHLIEMGLEAYKQDCGDYPRLIDPPPNPTTPTTAMPPNWLDSQQDRGARLLCRAMLGPAPGPDPANPGVPRNGEDGADGPGFRARRLTNSGKVYGPYLQADKFVLGGTDKLLFTDAVILDSNRAPILYCPAAPGLRASNPTVLYVQFVNPAVVNPQAAIKPVYNAFDNANYLPVGEMQYIMGDRNNSGFLENATITTPAESPSTNAPFLLWTAGADGIFGRLKNKTDDVTNFEIPPDVRK